MRALGASREQLGAKYPGLKLVAEKVADGQAATGHNIMIDLITANPDLRGVFASNLIMTQGVGQAILEAKRADTIKVIGFDSDDLTVKFVENGTIYGLVVQDPFRMGYEGVRTALVASRGGTVERFVDTGTNFISHPNIGGERQQTLLNPHVK